MAEGLFNHISYKEGLPFTSKSAGIFAQEGSLASPNSIQVMKNKGINLSSHRAKQVNPASIHQADYIFTMTQGHLQLLLSQYPNIKEKAFVFSPQIQDPYGGSLSSYQNTANQLEQQIMEMIQHLSKE